MDDFYLQKSVELATQVRSVLHGFPKLSKPWSEGEHQQDSGKKVLFYFISYGTRYRENTVIWYWYLPIPSSGTGSVLEASGTGSVLEASSTAP